MIYQFSGIGRKEGKNGGREGEREGKTAFANFHSVNTAIMADPKLPMCPSH